MKYLRKTISILLSLSIIFTMFCLPGITVFAGDTITVSGKVTIADSVDGDSGAMGISGINIYVDTDEAPVATTAADGTFTAEVPTGTTELLITGFTYVNGVKDLTTGSTIDRTVTLAGNADVSGFEIPIIICDYNADGYVTGLDYTSFKNGMDSHTGDANFSVYYDLTADGYVTGLDYTSFKEFSGNVDNTFEYPELELSEQTHIHSFVTEVTDPTCTEQGYTTYTCTECDYSYVDNYTDALGHDYQAVVTAPTCTEGGYTTHTCSRCGDTYTDDITAASGHTAAEAVRENETAANCTESGSYDSVVYCSVCGTELSRETVTVDALGHDWGDWTVTTAAVAPTCTENGSAAVETRTCSRCGETETRGGEAISATGHTYTTEITAPTCTEQGYTTYTCTVCGDGYVNDYVNALGHDYQTVVTAPTCIEDGYTTYTCSRCSDTYTSDETDAIGHTAATAVRENETAANCTEIGSYDSVVYCSVCGAELSRETVTVNALGHDYQAVVTAPTCTEGGYTTYTCSRCNNSYTSDATNALGHNWGDWVVTTAPTYTQTGIKTKTCSRCGATQTEVIPVIEHIDNIDVKLENTDVYLYRAGNANNIAMSSLFEAADTNKTIDASGVSVTVANIAGNASGTFTKNSSDWTASTLKFSNTGVVKLTVKQFNAQANENETAAELYLEIVAGTNYADGATLGSVSSNNAVLLGNVIITNKTGMSINNGKTLYGNGFSVTDSRSDTATPSGYINMSGNGSIDNARCIGQVYPSAVSSGISNQYYAPGIWITGNANIYNSYVCEAKNAVQIDGGNVNLINSTFDGGAICNIQIGGGDVTIKDCITTTSTNGGLKGLGIRGTSADCKISIEGTFTQYNWLKSSELPSTYSSVLNSVYNDTAYAFNYGGTKYVNMGIFFITDANAITADMAQAAINDSTSNTYGFIEKTYASLTGTLYTAKSSMGSAAMLGAPTAYSPRTHGQYYTLPAHNFNYTLNDFTTDDKTYCTYNGTTGVTQISFEENSSMNWNSSILTVTKLGNALPYTVTMNGTDYTEQSIPFTAAGDYTVNYTYTDPYNYDKDGNAFSVTYTKTVPISVTVVEHGVEIYHPDFTYADIGGTTASRQVEATVSGAKRIYVMPDVSSTSSTIESKSVGGQTIYYPVVQVPASSSSGGNFSSGKLYYFAPAFKNINIVDYDQSNQTTKTAKYTYDSNTQKWPHNITGTSQPDTSVYYYTATNTSSNTNRPYGRSMNEQYYGYQYVSSRGGLCYVSKEIEKENNANSQLVEFYYKGTDDVTYYYYIKYSFAYGKGSSGSCVADGSLVTMADGTKKPVEDVQVGDMVKTWSFYKGCYEDQPIVANMYHGTQEFEVLKLKFSDGSDLDIIYDHGLFDADLNTNVYINFDNVYRYLGDKFIKDGNSEVELTGYEKTTRTAGAYAPLTAENNNCYINGLYTICSEEECHGLFEYFDIGEGMKYDEAQMHKDIETYGVYTYDDLSVCMSEELFNAINAKYFKISAQKHGIERDEIARIFNQYM